MAGMEGFGPPAYGLTNNLTNIMALPVGFEPTVYSLGVCRVIQVALREHLTKLCTFLDDSHLKNLSH